jgi:hypothetical protein
MRKKTFLIHSPDTFKVCPKGTFTIHQKIDFYRFAKNLFSLKAFLFDQERTEILKAGSDVKG